MFLSWPGAFLNATIDVYTYVCTCIHTYTHTHIHTHTLSLSRNHDLNPCLNPNFICVCVQSAKAVGEGSEMNVSPLIKNGSKKGSCACLCGGQGLWEYQAYDIIRQVQSHVISRISLSRMQPRIYLLKKLALPEKNGPAGEQSDGSQAVPNSIKKSSHLCWAL